MHNGSCEIWPSRITLTSQSTLENTHYVETITNKLYNFMKLQPLLITVCWRCGRRIDRESNIMDQRRIREAINIRKEQDKLTNQDEASYQLHHIYDYIQYSPPQRRLVDSRSDEGRNRCRNVNKPVNKGCNLTKLYYNLLITVGRRSVPDIRY